MTMFPGMLENFKEPCVLVEKQRVSDGEGGFVTSWVDAAHFDAVIATDSSTLAKIAESQGVKNLYSVLTASSAHLEFHDVFRRVRDGQVFRVTSDGDDNCAPSVSSFDFEKVSAEEWVIP